MVRRPWRGEGSAGDPDQKWTERLAMANARIPFRLKVAVVWGVIFLLLGVLFWLAQYDTQWMKDQLGFIAAGIKFTLINALAGIIIATTLATLGALGRLSSNSIAYGVSGFYVSFFRGTPLIVQIFLVYLALPQVSRTLGDRYPSMADPLDNALVLSAAVAGIIALGLNYGAYMTEIFRAGIESVAGGQGEAADALGMTHGQKMRKVILPQAFRVVVPPTGNEFIAMIKDTALITVLGASIEQAEIFRRASLVGKADFKNLEALVVAAGLYWAITAVFTFFQARLETRLSRGYVRTASSGRPSAVNPHG